LLMSCSLEKVEKVCRANIPLGHTHLAFTIGKVSWLLKSLSPATVLVCLLSPFSCDLRCKVLYSTALTVRSHITIFCVIVIHGTASFKQEDAYYLMFCHSSATDFLLKA